MSPAASLVASPRLRATPYARRLARERNLPLSAIAGTGPNGRIIGDDLKRFTEPALEPTASASKPAAVAAPVAQAPAAAPTPAASVASVTTPAAIATRVDFAALDALLQRIAEVRPDVTRMDVCLKAAANALGGAPGITADGSILLLTAPEKRQRLAGLADASVSTVAAMRTKSDTSGRAGLAVSFLGRPGVRPVAAKLIDGAPARLVIGTAEADGAADCLLSYDPAAVADDAAEDFLVSFRELVETPFRLLV
jgi:pyruvate/2-oxoglutarate dehydrogenase complex dihydrolipoamide acyltransferase (E2) component